MFRYTTSLMITKNLVKSSGKGVLFYIFTDAEAEKPGEGLAHATQWINPRARG